MSRSIVMSLVILAMSCILSVTQAQTIRFEGAVELKPQGGNWTPVFSGDEMRAGDQLRTLTGEATLDFGAGAFLKISANSELHRLPVGYALIAGKAYAEAQRLNLKLGEITLTLSGNARFDAVQEHRVAVFQGNARYTQVGRVIFIEAGQQAYFTTPEDLVISDYFEVDPWYQDLLVLGASEAKVQGLLGEAELRQPDDDWRRADSQSVLLTDGAARTGAEAWLELIFANGNIVRLQELTEVILKTSVTLENGSQQTVLELVRGSAWLIVENKDEQSFQIQTPGLVAGVRGTTFRVISADADTAPRIKVFDGVVVGVTATSGTRIGVDQQFDPEAGLAELMLDAVDSFNIARDDLLASDVPPPLDFVRPLPELVAEASFTLQAMTETGALVELDGESIVLGRDGSFAVQVELQEGLNEFVLDIRARGFLRREVIRIERDVTPPSLNIAPLGTLTSRESILFAGSVDAGSIVEVLDNQVAVENNRFSTELTLDEGANIITVRVSDQAGNSVSERYLVVRDSTAPELTVDVVGGTITRAATSMVIGQTEIGAEVQVMSADRIIPVKVFTDGSFSSHVELDLGENSFEVRATDQAGNTSRRAFRIMRSLEAPSLDLSFPLEDSITREESIVIEGMTTAERLLINGQVIALQETSFSSEWSLQEGRNSFVIEALDQIGNGERRIVTVVRDTQAPEMTFFTLPQAEITVDEAAFLILAQTEPNASLRLNDEPLALLDSGVLRHDISLAVGENTLTFSVSDPLGNERSYVFTITYQPQ